MPAPDRPRYVNETGKDAFFQNAPIVTGVSGEPWCSAVEPQPPTRTNVLLGDGDKEELMYGKAGYGEGTNGTAQLEKLI